MWYYLGMPNFQARSGQIDFTDIRWAPVINCVVRYKNKILLVKRSEKLNLYPGYWNGISGFLDDQKSLNEKVREELREELGLDSNSIRSIEAGQVFDQDEPQYNKTWIVHPVLVEVNTDKIITDWEADSHAWLRIEEVRAKKILPGFNQVLKALNL